MPERIEPITREQAARSGKELPSYHSLGVPLLFRKTRYTFPLPRL